jgi:hypothetical protein
MLAAEPSAAVTSPGRKLASTIAYLARVLKTPTIGTWEELADKARASGWSHAEYTATVLQRQDRPRYRVGPGRTPGLARYCDELDQPSNQGPPHGPARAGTPTPTTIQASGAR